MSYIDYKAFGGTFSSCLRAVCVVVLMVCGATVLRAQDEVVEKSGVAEKRKVYQGFSGGMLLHTGYLFGIDGAAPVAADGRSYSPQGGVFGIGGCARVHLWKYLRVGFEGFVSTMYQGMMDNRELLRPGSYVRTGCGGVMADACWRLPKVWPYVGASLGGGAMRSLYMLDGDQESWARQSDTYFHKQGFFYVAPYVGCDYAMSKKMHLTFRLDWMLAISQRELAKPSGPRLYVGFIFVH